MEEEEKIVKGDDVVVELDASLEDLYLGGSLKVTTNSTHTLCSILYQLVHLYIIF